MGLFDMFKKRDEPKKDAPLPVQPHPPLTFQLHGSFEIASCLGKYALNYFEQLRIQGRTAGFNVILLGGSDDLESLDENRELSETSVDEHLRLAGEVNVRQWLKNRVEADPECFQVDPGDWPSGTPQAGSISAHLEILTRKPKDTVYLAKIPTAENWEVLAYIGMGGWNDCPDAAVLTAFAKYWHEQYGAEVASITRDVIEFIVEKPPVTREVAMALAHEQYIFCPDIVDQGVGNISTLAATLLQSKYWYFWWD